jgi:hypothetical protein
MARLPGTLLALALVLASSLGNVAQAGEDRRSGAESRLAVPGQSFWPRSIAPPQSIRQLVACCKTCRKGKACGDSCISRNKTCHQPPGCACDAK